MSRRTRSDLLDNIPPDDVTLRCGAGVHHACPSCACLCHDRQPELPGVTP